MFKRDKIKGFNGKEIKFVNFPE